LKDFSKILDHPDSEDIVSKLLSDISPKDVSDWLRIKYQDDNQKHLRLGQSLLKDFKDNNIDLYNDFKNDVNAVKSGNLATASKALQDNRSYHEKIEEYADKELDVVKIMSRLSTIIEHRVAQLFDIIQKNPQDNRNSKTDHLLVRYLEMFKGYIDSAMKSNGVPDQIIQHNFTIEKVEQNTAIFQDVVREVMLEVDPDMAFLFIDKLNDRLSKMRNTEDDSKSINAKFVDVKLLEEKIKDLEEE